MDVSTAIVAAAGGACVLLVFNSLVILGLVRAVARLQAASPPVVDERQAPAFKALDITGASFDSRVLEGRPRALLFVSTDCRSCMATLDEVRAVGIKIAGTVVVVCRGSPEDCQVAASEHGITYPVLVDRGDVSALYDVTVVPTAVLIGPDDRIRSWGNPARGDVEGLIRATAATTQHEEVIGVQ